MTWLFFSRFPLWLRVGFFLRNEQSIECLRFSSVAWDPSLEWLDSSVVWMSWWFFIVSYSFHGLAAYCSDVFSPWSFWNGFNLQKWKILCLSELTERSNLYVWFGLFYKIWKDPLYVLFRNTFTSDFMTFSVLSQTLISMLYFSLDCVTFLWNLEL